MQAKRDLSLDILRGLAVFTMLFANMGPLMTEHPIAYRLYGSFAAPIFICLAGMMVGRAKIFSQHTFSYYLIRGFIILLTAVLIDMFAWNIFPFSTFDVLYIIGLGLPLTFLVTRLQPKFQLFLSLSIFALTPILQKAFGYTYYPTEYYLSGELTVEVEKQTSILQHFFIDGWFPFFPWFGFMSLGAYFSSLRYATEDFFPNAWHAFTFLILLVASSICWYLMPSQFLIREGYSELFYPPSLPYILVAISLILLLLWFFDQVKEWKLWYFFRSFGEFSFLFYVVHIFVIGRLWYEPLLGKLSMQEGLLHYLQLALGLFLLALIVKLIKKKYPPRRLPFTLFFGS